MAVENWTIENLQQLLGQEETSSLEFKQSAALTNTDPHKKELVRDVTALANAAGGTIVYGIVEENGIATVIDEGIDVAPEWIEQVLESNAEPKVAGVVVKRIPLSEGRWAFAIEVPQATALAPHQSKQHHQYFRRHGRKVLPMLDHEVRDLMRRGSAPHLYLTFRLYHRIDDIFQLKVAIGNRSAAPAEYGAVHVGLSLSLAPPNKLQNFNVEEAIGQLDEDTYPLRTFVRNFVPPNHLPIFREQVWTWLTLDVTVPRGSKHPIFYNMACPGFAETAAGFITREDDLLANVTLSEITNV